MAAHEAGLHPGPSGPIQPHVISALADDYRCQQRCAEQATVRASRSGVLLLATGVSKARRVNKREHVPERNAADPSADIDIEPACDNQEECIKRSASHRRTK
jgi:hypothetical protein